MWLVSSEGSLLLRGDCRAIMGIRGRLYMEIGTFIGMFYKTGEELKLAWVLSEERI